MTSDAPPLSGLVAFPLTPTSPAGEPDEAAFARLVARLREARVDAVAALGSTGSYPYLDRGQRARVARRAVTEAADVPVVVGVGALRTADVLAHAEDAQAAGAAALLLAPVSYQRLTDEEVLGLFEDLSAACSVPLCVYENPATTGFAFSDELHGRVAALPGVVAVKVPPLGTDAAGTGVRLAALRAHLPAGMRVLVSGDASAPEALLAGADGWASVLGGLFPAPALALVRDAAAGRAEEVRAAAERLAPLWALFARHGSLRVVAAAAAHLGLTEEVALPRPLRPLDAVARGDVIAALSAGGLAS